MALKVYKSIVHNKVKMESGYFYSFKYTAYEEDPSPMIVFISAIKGTHPKTKHQWRLIQGINMNYIPRGHRKTFVQLWSKNIENGKSVEFTWEIVKAKFPYLKFAIRRYMIVPKYYIRNLKKIEFDKLEKEIVKSWHRDFSSNLKRRLGSRLKRFFSGTRK